jgi:hypothetical protein
MRDGVGQRLIHDSARWTFPYVAHTRNVSHGTKPPMMRILTIENHVESEWKRHLVPRQGRVDVYGGVCSGSALCRFGLLIGTASRPSFVSVRLDDCSVTQCARRRKRGGRGRFIIGPGRWRWGCLAIRVKTVTGDGSRLHGPVESTLEYRFFPGLERAESRESRESRESGAEQHQE